MSDYVYYTWRDTALTAVGGPGGEGVDIGILGQLGLPSQPGLFAKDEVPSIGLPLLMEFRTYPDSMAFGLNGFKVNLAINTSSRVSTSISKRTDIPGIMSSGSDSTRSTVTRKERRSERVLAGVVAIGATLLTTPR